MKQKNILFGIHAVLEALDSHQSISKIWIKKASTHPLHKKIFFVAKERDIPVSQVPLPKLNYLTSGQHQGVVATLSPIHFSDLATVIQTTYEKGKNPLIVLLNKIEDTRNLGALIRTAVAAEVDAIVLPTKGSLPIDGMTMKTSAGMLLHMPICRVSDLVKSIQTLQENGITVIACTEKAKVPYYQANFQNPTALLLGGEAAGITPRYLMMSEQQVTIPMQEKVNSLNLSVATSIILYEAVRQRTLNPHQ